MSNRSKPKHSLVDYVICAIAAIFIFAYAGMAFSPYPTGATEKPVIEEKAEAPETAEPEKEPEAIELQDLKAHFIDVGQGDSELVQLPDGKVMLIDAGEASAGATVVSYLQSQGIEKIDYLVATHPHADHIGGMEAVLEAFEVCEVWMPDATENTSTYIGFLDAVKQKDIPVERAEAGKTIDDSVDYDIDVLGPESNVQSDNMNDYSVIIRVSYDRTKMLFTGDATAQEIIDANPGNIDVLKAAHHGSEAGTNAALLGVLKPATVIMSYAEGNEHGHPDQSVLDAIKTAGATAYSTAANGNIVITSGQAGCSATISKTGSIIAGISAAEKARQEQEAAAVAQAQAEAQQLQQQQQQQQSTVYVTPTGSKFHLKNCRTLNRTKNPTPMSKQDAINSGYQPCGVCNP